MCRSLNSNNLNVVISGPLSLRSLARSCSRPSPPRCFTTLGSNFPLVLLFFLVGPGVALAALTATASSLLQNKRLSPSFLAGVTSASTQLLLLVLWRVGLHTSFSSFFCWCGTSDQPLLTLQPVFLKLVQETVDQLPVVASLLPFFSSFCTLRRELLRHRADRKSNCLSHLLPGII